MKSRKQAEWKMEPILEGTTHVWVVTRGGETKYCWPQNGLSSLEIAKQLLNELNVKA